MVESAERLARRATNSEIFTGTLTSKTRPDLQDIAHALSIRTDGKKQELVDRINGHATSHPEVKENPRFSSLFVQRGRGRLPIDSRGPNVHTQLSPNVPTVQYSLQTTPLAGPSHFLNPPPTSISNEFYSLCPAAPYRFSPTFKNRFTLLCRSMFCQYPISLNTPQRHSLFSSLIDI